MESQVKVFIDGGAGELTLSFPATYVEAYNEEGEEVLKDYSPSEIIAIYNALTEALVAGGHSLGGGAPAANGAAPAANNGPLPPGMPVPVHCGRPCEFKEAFVNPKTKKSVPAKYQCTNDDCPTKGETGYKWSIFVDKYIKEQGGQ